MIKVKYVPKLSLIFQDLLNDTYIPELIDDLNVSLTAEINDIKINVDVNSDNITDIKINVDVNSDNITENAANIKILEEGTLFTVISSHTS